MSGKVPFDMQVVNVIVYYTGEFNGKGLKILCSIEQK